MKKRRKEQWENVPFSVALKLASAMIHADEMLSPAGHALDQEALRGIVQDAEVQAWLKSVPDVLLPVKR